MVFLKAIRPPLWSWRVIIKSKNIKIEKVESNKPSVLNPLLFMARSECTKIWLIIWQEKVWITHIAFLWRWFHKLIPWNGFTSENFPFVRVIFHFYNLQLIFDFSSKRKKVILFYCQHAWLYQSFLFGFTSDPSMAKRWQSSLKRRLLKFPSCV